MVLVMATVAAVDLGASSGRVMLAEVGPDRLHLEAVARFGNDPVRLPDGLHWNVVELYRQAVLGLRAAAGQADLESVGVDSWAVDYGLLAGGRLLGLPYHYRDERCGGGVERVHASLPHEQLFARNGLQFLPFNTLYQLAVDPLAAQAESMLLIPDLLGYWFTGRAVSERTNASTTGLLDVRTGEWDTDLAGRLGIPPHLLGELVDPGTVIAPVRAEVGIGAVPLTAVGSHDTASAVVGVPMLDEGAAYVSCGTWGLVGLELERPVLTDHARAANFTNERGVDGRVRFLTNVMGTWLLSETVRAWGTELLPLLAAAGEVRGPVPLFDVQDPRFLPPGDMPRRIEAWFAERELETPADRPTMIRTIVESLAQAYADALARAAELAGHDIELVHLVGGGSQNALLGQAMADRSGRPVLAGPVEATAIGNVLVQFRRVAATSASLEALRQLVAKTTEPRRFEPRSVRTRS